MEKFLTASRVALCGLGTLALLSSCGSSGSHADAAPKADSGGDKGGGGSEGGAAGSDGAAGGGGGGGGAAGGKDGGMEAGPDAASCLSAGVCGGNIASAWSITSSCLDVDVSGAVPDYCPTATVQPMGFQLTGTLTYKGDLTYSRKTTISGNVIITFPASCLAGADGGAPLTCDQLATQLKLDPTYSAVTCATAGSGCACTGTLVPQSQTKTGMYTTTSAGLLIESETGRTPPDVSDYCIRTDTLTTSAHSMAMGMMSMSGTITASRVVVVQDGGTDGGDAAGEASSDAGTSDATGN